MNTIDTEAIPAYLGAKAAASGGQNICVSLSVQGRRHAWSTAATDGVPPIFQIGCITKAIVAALAMELDEDGVLDVDAPLARYLEEFSGKPAGEEVLVRHLLSDTRGYLGISFLGADAADLTWKGFVQLVAEGPKVFAPGTVCSLDYANFALLGAVINRATGRHWIECVDDLFGRPLFGRSLFKEKDRTALWSAAVASTQLDPAELAVLAEILMTGAAAPWGRLLRPTTVSRLQQAVVHTPQLVGGRFTHWLPAGHGLGLPVYHSGLRGECGKGRGQLSSIRLHAEKKVALAVCVDSNNTFVRHEVIDAVLEMMGIPPPQPVDSVEMGVPAHELPGEYIGLRGVSVRVEVDGRRVVAIVCNAGREATYFGTINADGTLSIDSGQKLAGLAIFRAPQSGVPALMFGVHALRRA